jgi:hypothetical protein
VSWIGAVFVSPEWGVASTALFSQAWLAFANFWIALIGFLRGKAGRGTPAVMMGVAAGSCALYSLLLRAGCWRPLKIDQIGADISNEN